ncbi:hypothetical protein LZ30DRAFT_733787 [Colletotrichum cereale]|nr:hypothetical protein LZ30DRAFT_733787 [Colletotrichum cereale]
MKYSAAIVAFAGFATAQTLNDLPQCAQQCLLNAITANGKCGVSDTTCLCNPTNFQAIVTAGTPCVLQNCGEDVAVNQVIPAAVRICQAPAGSGVATSAVRSASSAVSAAVSSAAAAASSVVGTTTSAPRAGTTRTAVVTSAVTAINGTVTATTTLVPVTVNGAAAQGPIGIAAAIALGAFAYL